MHNWLSMISSQPFEIMLTSNTYPDACALMSWSRLFRSLRDEKGPKMQPQAKAAATCMTDPKPMPLRGKWKHSYFGLGYEYCTEMVESPSTAMAKSQKGLLTALPHLKCHHRRRGNPIIEGESKQTGGLSPGLSDSNDPPDSDYLLHHLPFSRLSV